MLPVLVTISQIITAGIVITALALLMYALTFNLRDRVARSFALVLVYICITFTGEALGGTSVTPYWITFWLKFQWAGIIMLPAGFLGFSDALLATTGDFSRTRRLWLGVVYLFSFGLVIALSADHFLGPVVLNVPPAPYLTATLTADLFTVFYVTAMLIAWWQIFQALRRTATPTSRRRMYYLLVGSVALGAGSFPFLLFGSGFASQYEMVFWLVAIFTNLLVGAMLTVMAYAVAFFGVPWPDRVVKSRLFKWLMRGPATASLTLGLVTLVRRLGEAFGASYTALVPLVMVGTILLSQYFITLFARYGEKVLFWGKDSADLELLRLLEERFITRDDLDQFQETILAAICDRLQAGGAYLLARDNGHFERIGQIGKTAPGNLVNEDLESALKTHDRASGFFEWQGDLILPLYTQTNGGELELLGAVGVTGLKKSVSDLNPEEWNALRLLTRRIELALQDRRAQEQIYASLEILSGQAEVIQRLRAAGQYDARVALAENLPVAQDLTIWVRDALTHYWGGPKLTESPLLQLQIVKNYLDEHSGNEANALRSVLKTAIEKNRPAGERRFTGEWMLYNILDLKFLEGRRMKEIAMKLAMSEADLYRKQRVAIDAVAKTLMDMEEEQLKGNGENRQG